MKLLFDLFPVILFYVVFMLAGEHPEAAQSIAAHAGYVAEAKLLPILLGTAAAIVAAVSQVAWVKLKHGKVDTMLWASFAIVVLFGGATLILRDPTLIKWKPTILFWFLASSLLFSRLASGKNLLREMLQKELVLPHHVWERLNVAYAVYFTFLGFANLYVAFYLFPGNDKAWANFKLWGVLGLSFVFLVVQAMMLSKYVEKDKEHN